MTEADADAAMTQARCVSRMSADTGSKSEEAD